MAIASKADSEHPDDWFDPRRKELTESLSLNETSLKRIISELYGRQERFSISGDFAI
jgi:hypothetical protein